MTRNLLQRFLSLFKSQPEPEFMAQQLRKPSGKHAKSVGKKMNQVNEPLYDLTLDVMQPQDHEKMLEIGFGTGKFFRKLFGRANGLKVSGIDYSEAMVESAKVENRDTINSGNLDIAVGNSNDLPYPDHSFDKAFSSMVVYFWDRPKAHLKEIHRVLKPAGKFYTGLRTKESMLLFPFVEHGFNLYKIHEWENILKQNGFFHLNTHTRMDPELDLDSNKLQLKSCCIVAQKKDI